VASSRNTDSRRIRLAASRASRGAASVSNQQSSGNSHGENRSFSNTPDRAHDSQTRRNSRLNGSSRDSQNRGDRKQKRGERNAKRSGTATPEQKRKRTITAIVLAVVAVVVVLCAVDVWNVWFRYDDASDFQGTFRDGNTSHAIVIDDTQIKLTSDTAYSYTLDTQNKKVNYSIGNFSGTSSYRFSNDRKTLVLSDDDTDWLVLLHLKADPVLDQGKGSESSVVLTKISDDTQGSPFTIGSK